MAILTIDDQKRAALSRLTDNEKDCLRRRLLHQTAKQMALDLDVSPHAVEKRLKMARAKLGLSSSLEAARTLEEWERYGQTGSQLPDLAIAIPKGKSRFIRQITLGAIMMSLLAATLIFVAQQGGVTPLSDGGITRLDAGDVAPLPPAGAAVRDGAPIVWKDYDQSELVEAIPSEVLVVVQNTFHVLDKDGSGFLEGNESPLQAPEGGSPVYRRADNGKVVPTGEVVHQTDAELRNGFYAQADIDRDGKVALHEYRRWASPGIARRGIPAEWKADMNRPIVTDPS